MAEGSPVSASDASQAAPCTPPGAGGGDDKIKVAIRVRPFNSREHVEQGGLEHAFQILPPATISVSKDEKQVGSKQLGYDFVYASDPAGPCFGTQLDMYCSVGKPLLDNALKSYNGCIFAYGQTGSGKSYSVLGDPEDADQKGILPRTCEDLFEMLESEKTSYIGLFTYTVLASYLEIYNEKLGDLLVTNATRDLAVRIHPTLGPHVPGLTQSPVTSYRDVHELLTFGAKNRIIAATNMNAQSSRSHAIFFVDVRMTRSGKDSHAVINFVDLAGSERQKKTGAAGARLKEGISINQSLTVLGKVIATLTSGKKGEVPPFRESKLTLLLKEALNGNSKTVLVACISPSIFNLEETVSTLEFATRCKLISTSAKRNEVDRKDLVEALLAEKAKMEAQLKGELAARAEVMGLVDAEKARVASLQQEMADIQEQLATSRMEAAGEEKKQIAAERDKAMADLDDARRGLETSRAMSQKEKDDALARLEAEMAEKEAVRQERESALEKVAQAEMERRQLLAEREQRQKQFEEERLKLTQSVEASKCEIEASVRKLEKEQAAKEALCREREEALEHLAREHAEKEAQLRQGVEEQARATEKLRAEREEAALEVERVRHQRDEVQSVMLKKEAELQQEKAAKLASEAEMQRRLEDLRKQRAEADLKKAAEFEATLKARVEKEEARDKEAQLKLAELQSRLETLTATKLDLQKKADKQREERNKALEELGFGAAGLSEEEREACPRLLNLHADPTLCRSLVFFLPARSSHPQGLTLGSDSSRCQIRLEGLGVGPEMCIFRNDDNRKVFATPRFGELVRVNGASIGEKGQELKDGDRVAIGQAYIFEVEIPVVRRAAGQDGRAKAEIDFTKAMEELDACADLDPRWKNGVNSAMHLVKREFGTKVANALLQEAARASEKLKLANNMLGEMPAHWRNGVESYDLAVLFDTHGLPLISVVARRRSSTTGQGPDALRDGSDAQCVWTARHFMNERLELMEEVYDEWMASGERATTIEQFQARDKYEDMRQSMVWADSIEAIHLCRDELLNGRDSDDDDDDDDDDADASPQSGAGASSAGGVWSSLLSWAQGVGGPSPTSSDPPPKAKSRGSVWDFLSSDTNGQDGTSQAGVAAAVVDASQNVASAVTSTFRNVVSAVVMANNLAEKKAAMVDRMAERAKSASRLQGTSRKSIAKSEDAETPHRAKSASRSSTRRETLRTQRALGTLKAPSPLPRQTSGSPAPASKFASGSPKGTVKLCSPPSTAKAAGASPKASPRGDKDSKPKTDPFDLSRFRRRSAEDVVDSPASPSGSSMTSTLSEPARPAARLQSTRERHSKAEKKLSMMEEFLSDSGMTGTVQVEEAREVIDTE
eukprot:TRINITY_DN5072_c1_g2_i1.p1 TRINITY_DN5072_c1_g2~~TRINITY_DN5072_c1_g2_i1.p1  ORF type:complete len:1356 (+),score=364.67 TRINITY_DN5072_c1_g2_i1:165-4232(+)